MILCLQTIIFLLQEVKWCSIEGNDFQMEFIKVINDELVEVFVIILDLNGLMRCFHRLLDVKVGVNDEIRDVFCWQVFPYSRE